MKNIFKVIVSIFSPFAYMLYPKSTDRKNINKENFDETKKS